MWNINNFMDQAKEMAANLDKQLNESVGIDDDGGASNENNNNNNVGTTAIDFSADIVQPSTPSLSSQVNAKQLSPPTTSTGVGMTAALPAATADENDFDDDAWNNDFDDGAFDDLEINDNENSNTGAQQEEPAQPTSSTKVVEQVAKTSPSAPPQPHPEPKVTPATIASPPPPASAAAKVPDVSSTLVPTPPVLTQPEIASLSPIDKTEIQEVQQEAESPDQGDGDIVMEDDTDQAEHEDENVDTQEETVPPPAAVPGTPVSPPSKEASPSSMNKGIKLPTSLAINASSMFSSLGSAAVSAAATAASAAAPKPARSTTSAGTTAPAPALSSFLSAATDKLAQVTAELDDSPGDEGIQQNSEDDGDDGRGWDGDDDGVFLDDENDIGSALQPKDVSTEEKSPSQPSPPPAAAVPDKATEVGKIGTEIQDVSSVEQETNTSPSAVTAAAPLTPAAPEPEAVSSQPRMAPSEDERSMPPPHCGPTAASLNVEDDPRYQALQKQLELREGQLASKAEQLTQLEEMWESQEQELRQKISETKEEAKKRIQRAKERCEAAEAKFNAVQNSGNESSAKQAGLIAELRSEGEKLAMKQSVMEQAVRAAKSESRELAHALEEETTAKENALEKNAELEAELKVTKESLNSARRGESQAGKLESDLLSARSDAEMKAGTILSLQQQVKELTAEGKELRAEVEKARKTAAQEANQEKKTLRREHNDIISDLETKLRTTEREAGVREDALRHEVTELRKRWQDAVRRADALSMDVQSSTAPLLRQLESMERQGRARAAGWAELENRLRAELEETVIQNETLSKERSEYKTKFTRLERSMKDHETEASQSKRTIEEQTEKIARLEMQLEELETESEKRQEEYVKVERLANEGVMRVRSEMTQTVVDSEERYRGQIAKLEGELKTEKDKRSQLEKQLDQLLENAGMMLPPQVTTHETGVRRESKPKKLRQAEGQAAILAGALGIEDSDDDDDEDGFAVNEPMDRGDGDSGAAEGRRGSMQSFAALEQLSSRLKAATFELEALKKNLRESEKERESLVKELGESLAAKEKLPLFEAKVQELTSDNREKELEIQGLREDIFEVKELYRAQLNMLLEEKATATAAATNGDANPTPTTNGDDEAPSKAETDRAEASSPLIES